MGVYFLSEYNQNEYSAANKARDDIEVIFKQNNFKPLDLYTNIKNKNGSFMILFMELIKTCLNICRKDIVFIQYPYYKNQNKTYFLLNLIRKIKKVKIVAVIHDINSLRLGDGVISIQNEINILNNFDCIISHNEKLTSWLRNNNCKVEIINLDIFDYLLEKDKMSTMSSDDIVFAGNLSKEKSGFIYKLIENKEISYSMNIYGPNFSNSLINDNIKYQGKYSASELICNLNGKYGLIWDGQSVDKCDGLSGEYTRYNNPHKLSMYIAAGLPVICWDQMAISDFILDNKIGLTINNLDELSNILEKISEEKYSLMVENVNKVRKKIIIGEFTMTAISKVIDR